ncbi:hypothetical protein SAMN05446935_4569 [Burkholderia sp. YR290]|nr:hypothetical protein PMI06_000493 [Burkholderia sp. BT03]SKD00925.1 hypothetical protein SAMN05446934_8343 [Paraburkholderia hospita]SKD03578.1 hypothetical protein SAMN06266956_8238 [Paraburkholderia hospita]SOE84143.1 hypothetical protein SAMN05446935_4569 [Burkholderia sp. YR290]
MPIGRYQSGVRQSCPSQAVAPCGTAFANTSLDVNRLKKWQLAQ